jgi:hypothetical protein
MIPQARAPHNPWLALLLLGCGLAAAGCEGTADRAAPTAAPPTPTPPADAAPASTGAPIIARLGEEVLTLADLQRAVEDARVLQHWQHGQRPGLQPLSNPLLRRRIAIKSLETRLVRDEVTRRGLTPDPGTLRAALAAFAAGQPITGEAPAPDAVLPDDAALDASLAARYGDPLRARSVTGDLLAARRLAAALLDDVGEDTLRSAWLREETRVRITLIRVPRVPTSREIDAAVQARKSEFPAYYERNRGLFVRPERAVVLWFQLDVPPNAEAATREARRAETEAFRARIGAGEDFETLARAHSDHGSARRGGRIGGVSRKRMPRAFEIEPGVLSPVEAHPRGFAFFKVERRIPGTTRPLSDERVQREIAAAILREADDLPHAMSVAREVQVALRRSPHGEPLDALIRKERLRRVDPRPFSRASGAVIEGLGLAPAVFEAAFRLRAASPVTDVVRVRQDYVVARLLDRSEPDPKTWPRVRDAYRETWRNKNGPLVLDRWLTAQQRDVKSWVDGARLAALTLETLGAAAPPNAPAEASPDHAGPPDDAGAQ